MKTKRKNIFKSLLALTLALIMVLGAAPLSELAGVDWASLFAPKAEAEGKLDCLEDMPLISESHYTGNQGDSCVFNLNRKGLPGIDNKYYRNGNVGVDGTVYNNGFEVWIARWNFGDKISWASATFDIGGKYKTLTGKSSVIKGSTNTTSYDTSVYFYNGETLLCSFRMTPDNYEKSFKVDVTGVSNLTVMVKDNKEAAGGTSFALYDLFFDNSYGNGESPIIPSTAVEFNGHYYQVYDNSMTWTEAKEYCEKLGGHLVTITSIEENNYIKDLVVSNGKKNAYWLGASDSETEGVWKWVTGEPFEFSDWGTDEPNQDGEENYLELLVNAINYSLKWNDSNLNGGGGMVSLQNHGFICEWDEIPESGGSVSESNLKTYYGTLEDTVIAAVTNGNASWIGGAIIDGKTYKLSRDSKYQSTISNCKGKKVVFTVKDDEIIWIKPAEDIKTSISCSVNPVSVMYSGKKYSSDTADVIVKISNTLCESDFVGDPEVLANIPELELIIPNAELKIDSNNIFSFNGKQIYSTPVKTLGLGESETFCVTANVKNKKPENAAEPKVGINCTFNVTQGNRSFSKVAYGAFKIINNGYKEPTQENVNNSGDKEYRDKLAKAAQELEKATTAFTLEADISNSLKQIFTQEQLDFIARMILCEAAMKGAPEETFQEELERKVIEKVFKINTRWLRLFNDKIVVTVAMKTQKYGVVQVEFTYNRQQSLLNNKPYAFYGNVEYKIIKSDKKLPDSVNRSGPTGAIYMADMSAFCKAAYSVAESELKRSYNKVWGDGANEAADIIFGKSVNNILSKTKYGSVSGLAWAIMTAPAKEVKIKCPVDIYVYDKNNKLVAAVEDNKVTLSDVNVDISVDGDTKTVMLYDETYRIEYKSAAESTMDVVISEFAGNDQLLKTTTFEKVPLKIGVNYTQNIDNTYMDDSEYSLTSNGEEKILPTETKLELHAHTSSSEWKVGREATCAEYGWNYNYCDECNEWYEVITTVDHTFGSWQIVTEPTVDSEGLEKRVCSKCGAEETRAISKLEPVQVTDVELDIAQKALNVGDTFTITATVKPDNATDKSVTWSSSNTSVATVDENGVVTAVSEGTATITATASNGVEASCTVTVKQKGDSILKKIFKFIFNIILAPFRAIINLFKKLFGK